MRYKVTEADTAAQVGSGDVPVLATPRLIAWLEAATVEAAKSLTAPGQTTVGTAVRIEHRRATHVGGTVEVIATPSSIGERRITFQVKAVDDDDKVVASGEIDRAIVDRSTFLSRSK